MAATKAATKPSLPIVLQNVKIQNVELQNVENTKHRITKRQITKRRNTKRRILQNVELQNVKNTKRPTVMGGRLKVGFGPLGQTQPSTVPPITVDLCHAFLTSNPTLT